MESVRNKRGLSPIVASVLLILLVLVLASMIFLWARGFVSEQIEKFGKPIDSYCDKVDFRASLNNGILEISNLGNIDIWYVEIKLTKGGNSEVSRFDFRIDSGTAVSEPVVLDMEGVDRVEVFPALIGNVRGSNSNKAVTCIDAGRVVA